MAFLDEVDFRDKFMTVWVILWFIPSLIVFCVFIKNPLKKRSWNTGLVVTTAFIIRCILDIIAWVSYCITLDESYTSVSFAIDIAILISSAVSMTLLYLFFIYRLWMTYNQSLDDNLHIHVCWFMSLSSLCTIYLVCGGFLTFCYYYDYTQLYTVMHGASLALELIMYVILVILFSKPLIVISVRKRALTNDHNDNHNKEKDKFLRLLTKLNILNTFTLLTSILLRAVDIAATIHCPNGCTVTYIQYSLWTVDAFVNVFCILCSFTNGDFYYFKFCGKLHSYILMGCVGKLIDRQVIVNRNQEIEIECESETEKDRTEMIECETETEQDLNEKS